MPSPTKPACGPATCCPPKPALNKRPQLSGGPALDVAALFKILANETRVSLLHALVRQDELCVSDLAQAIGMKPQAVSNQLQKLADRGMVALRREGTHIWYRIADPCVADLLDRGLCLLEDARDRAKSARR